jgi:hypothetical protein
MVRRRTVRGKECEEQGTVNWNLKARTPGHSLGPTLGAVRHRFGITAEWTRF